MAAHKRKVDVTARNEVAIRRAATNIAARFYNIVGVIMPAQTARLRAAETQPLKTRHLAFEIDGVRKMKNSPIRKCRL